MEAAESQRSITGRLAAIRYNAGAAKYAIIIGEALAGHYKTVDLVAIVETFTFLNDSKKAGRVHECKEALGIATAGGNSDDCS